jgi:outer membrane protein OmpA-like peptidoglycan-associated protein
MYVANAILRPKVGDTTWQKISMIYTATGKEVYLTLGNFSRRDISGATGIPREDHFFIFFDDVSLTPADPREKICNTWQRTRDEIYAFDARHHFLDLYVKTYIKRPPDPPEIESTSVHIVDTLVIPDILFETDKSTLSKNSFHLMDSLCHALLGKQIDSLVVEGHTDSTGAVDHNEKLSNDRAVTVASYIIKNISLRQPLIITRGWASEKPVADNRTAAGRQLNRRVELFIYIRQ